LLNMFLFTLTLNYTAPEFSMFVDLYISNYTPGAEFPFLELYLIILRYHYLSWDV